MKYFLLKTRPALTAQDAAELFHVPVEDVVLDAAYLKKGDLITLLNVETKSMHQRRVTGYDHMTGTLGFEELYG